MSANRRVVGVSIVDHEHFAISHQERPAVTPVNNLTRVGIQYRAISKSHSAVMGGEHRELMRIHL